MIATIDKEKLSRYIDTLREDYEMFKIFLTFVKRDVNERKKRKFLFKMQNLAKRFETRDGIKEINKALGIIKTQRE